MARRTANAGRFAQPDEYRLALHKALFEKEGIKHPEAFQPHTFRDKLTGWFTDRERIPTIARAQQYLKEHPEEQRKGAVYAAADVGNLGGLNDALGEHHANEVFRGIADIFADHLHKLGGDVVLIRHGGDEFSAVAVGADRPTVEKALADARAEVAQYIHSLGLEKLPHAKEPFNPDKAGVGMYTDSEFISEDSTPKEIIEDVDAGIELAKKVRQAQAAKPQQQQAAPTGHPLLDAEQWTEYQNELQAMSAENRAMAERFVDKLRDYPAAVAEYAMLKDSHGGKVLNADIARELSPDYLKDRTKSGVVHTLASAFVRRMYAEKLAATNKPKVLFSAGGPGVGKTTVLEGRPYMENKADIVYDTTMSHYDSAKGMIDQALDANGEAHVVLVIREPTDALLNGVIRRAVKQEKQYGSGRTVKLDYFLSAQPAAIRNVFRLAEDYKDNPNVRFTFMDNTHGFGNTKEVSLEQAKQIEFQQVEARAMEILEQEYRDGKISKEIYTGIKQGFDVAGGAR